MKSFWKRILVVAMAVILLCSSVACGRNEKNAEIDGDLAYYRLEDGTYGVGVAEEKRETVTSIAIPETYNGMAVTRIVREGFADCVALQSVALSSKLEVVGDFAFANCYSMSEIAMGGRLVQIGRYAFSSCASLASVAIPDSVALIGDYAFAFCISLKNADLPASLQKVNENLFYKCIELETVAVPDSVVKIEKYAFWDCSKLSVLSIGSGVEEIDVSAFRGCRSMTAIHISAENDFFRSASGILYDRPTTRIIYIPEKLSGSIIIPEGVIAIDSSAFAGQNEITSVSLPKSLTSIGGSAFAGCSSLENVIFADTKGWKSGSVSISATALANEETAASFLTQYYTYDAWKK